MRNKCFALLIYDLYLLGFSNREDGGLIIDEEFMQELIMFNQITYEENMLAISLLSKVTEEKLEDGQTSYKVTFELSKELITEVSSILSKMNDPRYLSKLFDSFPNNEQQIIADYASDFNAFILWLEETSYEENKDVNSLYKYLKQ